MQLTAERLRKLLHYNPYAGVFTWKAIRRGHSICDVVGVSTKNGYRRIGIDGRDYLAHRLAWLWMTGTWPINQVDHINLDRADNRFCNLREATNSQNRANTRVYSNNTSGFKGVTWHKQARKWQAQIQIEGRHHSLGLFEMPEAAHTAYATAVQKGFGEFARVS